MEKSLYSKCSQMADNGKRSQRRSMLQRGSICLPSAVCLLFFIKLLIYWLCWVLSAVWAFLQLWRAGSAFHSWCPGFSLAAASLVAERRLWSIWASVTAAYGLGSCSSQAPAHRPSSRAAQTPLLCGVWDLPGQGPNPCLLCWQADSFPPSHQGSPMYLLLIYVFLYFAVNCIMTLQLGNQALLYDKVVER